MTMPSYYNPYQYPQQMQPQIQQMQPQMQQAPIVQQPQPQPQPQIQNGGFVSVRGETEARNYPVAPGNSITFKDEIAPYVYTKTMGFSQLDRPVFEKYKLVKETVAEPSSIEENEIETSNSIIEDLKHQIGALWNEIDTLKEHNTTSAPKRYSSKKEKEVEEE